MNYNEWIKNGFAVKTTFAGVVDRIITDATVICRKELCSDGQQHTKQIKVLWDTGASCSSIDRSLARELKLIPIGKSLIAHANGQSIVNKYTFDFALHNAFVLNISTASEGIFSGGEFQMLLGMDVIAMGDFFFGQYEENGKPCSYITFSVPSIDRNIDFVEELNSKRRAEISGSFTRHQIPRKKKKKKNS